MYTNSMQCIQKSNLYTSFFVCRIGDSEHCRFLVPGNTQKILKNDGEKWSRKNCFEIPRAPSEIPANQPGQFSLSVQIFLHWTAATLKGHVEFQNNFFQTSFHQFTNLSLEMTIFGLKKIVKSGLDKFN